mgnify:CR=1 FL=1
MGYCLPKFASEEFKRRIKSGEIHPAKLSKMTSKERHDLFASIVGPENAGPVNASFEQRLLLKNQQAGIIRWAKEVTGIKPEVRRDILSRVNKMTEILQPKELDMFLEDLAGRKLGVGVSAEEAGIIADLAADVRAKEGSEDRMEYGRAKVKFGNYVSKLKLEAEKETVLEKIKRPGKALVEVGGQAKSIKASLDVSAIFRQGLKTMITHPKQWLKSSAMTFVDVFNTYGGKETVDEVMADIVSRPNYDKMVKARLAVGSIEEAYPSSVPEKALGYVGDKIESLNIPLVGTPLARIVGKTFKASQAAYTGFVYRTRADVFDKYMEIAEQAGVDVTDKAELESIGKLVNSLVGRGHLGPLEPAADALNNIFFSPRLLKSHIDVLTAHAADPTMSKFAKKQAARNLAKIVGGIALILGIAMALDDESVETDPRSADFGKIRYGNTRFDVSGGMAAVVTLAMRILTYSTKSSTTDKVTDINSGEYGAQNGIDVLQSFMENKASPLGAVFLDILRGEDFNGNKPTVLNELGNLYLPLPAATFHELKTESGAAPLLLGMITEGVGISTNTYGGGSAAGIIADRLEVKQQIFELILAGDEEGAKDLANDYNVQLRDAIRTEMIKDNKIPEGEELDKKVDAKWKKNGIGLPTEEELADYRLNDNRIIERTKAGKPIVREDEPLPSRGVIGVVLTYAHAIGVDPVTAFNRIFTGQRITRIDNGTVIVERMSLKDSQKIKTDRDGNNPTVKLDHTIPLQLGGSNSEDNLKLVPTEDWERYTPVENYLGEALRQGDISKELAQQYMRDFKAGNMTFEDIQAAL